MGKDDLYPFVLSPVADQKLAFVHDRVGPWQAADVSRQPRRRGGRQAEAGAGAEVGAEVGAGAGGGQRRKAAS
jgi:hypothetical protein